MAAAPEVIFVTRDDELVMQLTGDWLIEHGPPTLDRVSDHLARAARGTRVRIEAAGIASWDSVLPSFLMRARSIAMARGLEFDAVDVPQGAIRLIDLATAVPRRGERAGAAPADLLERAGEAATATLRSAADAVDFLGEAAVAFGRLLRGRALLRGRDFWLAVQHAGASALPIVGLISFLVGMIQAFVGGSQLALFGAEIFVANLVAIAMLREMGPLMAALIMAGRTGSSYAAELGTM